MSENSKIPNLPEPGDGWRLLGDEIIAEGDEQLNPYPREGESKGWQPIYSHAIGKRSGFIMRYFRRQKYPECVLVVIPWWYRLRNLFGFYNWIGIIPWAIAWGPSVAWMLFWLVPEDCGVDLEKHPSWRRVPYDPLDRENWIVKHHADGTSESLNRKRIVRRMPKAVR